MHHLGDVLFVVAYAPQDRSMIEAIAGCRPKFRPIVAWLTDSYFQAGFGRATAQYDAITVTAHGDVAHPQTRYGMPVHQVYQGVDGLGAAAGPSVHLERGMLFKLLHRSKMTLAFHLSVEPQGPRPRAMMVSSRWLESLLAGCLVAGKRPVSRMSDDMLCWPASTVELADDAQQAGDQLQQLLLQHAWVHGRTVWRADSPNSSRASSGER